MTILEIQIEFKASDSFAVFIEKHKNKNLP